MSLSKRAKSVNATFTITNTSAIIYVGITSSKDQPSSTQFKLGNGKDDQPLLNFTSIYLKANSSESIEFSGLNSSSEYQVLAAAGPLDERSTADLQIITKTIKTSHPCFMEMLVWGKCIILLLFFMFMN